MLIKVNKNNDKYEVATVDADNIELQTKTVTENGDVTPDTGYYGLSKVTVNIATPVLEANKTVTIDASNYTEPVEITPSSGNDAMSKATITLSNLGGINFNDTLNIHLFEYKNTSDEYFLMLFIGADGKPINEETDIGNATKIYSFRYADFMNEVNDFEEEYTRGNSENDEIITSLVDLINFKRYS